MAKKATISVRGPIGKFSYIDEKGKKVAVNGLQLVDVVSQFTRLAEDTKEVTIEVGSLGGSVPVAKAMRGFIKSMQPRYTITTRQVDDIASSGTIIFTSGSRRIAAKGINPETGEKFRMMVHNPWVTHFAGNADDMDQESASLRMTEQEFADIYGEDIGISSAAIQPLMKAESFFDADQATDLKFATETYQALNQAAYKNSNPTMAKTKKKLSFSEKLALLFKGELEGEEIVAAAPPAELKGKPVLINGVAAVDGVYTVVGGVVTALSAVEEEQAGEDPAASSNPAAAKVGVTKEDVAAIVAEALKGNKKKKAAAADEDEDEDEELSKEERIAIAVAKGMRGYVDEQINGVKKNQKTTHVPIGFKPENKTADAAEWDRSYKANEHTAMKRDDPDKWMRLFYAKYGKMPV